MEKEKEKEKELKVENKKKRGQEAISQSQSTSSLPEFAFKNKKAKGTKQILYFNPYNKSTYVIRGTQEEERGTSKP